MLFAAVHESLVGTKRTSVGTKRKSRSRQLMSALWGKYAEARVFNNVLEGAAISVSISK